KNKNSRDFTTMVACCSAIRKAIAMSPVDDLQWAADLIKSAQNYECSIDIELEVAKMIDRKFSANIPNDGKEVYPDLACSLLEIVIEYSSVRLFNKDKYAATIMLSI